MDLHTLQHIPDVLKRADLHKLREELLACLPSLPNMPDLHRLREELTKSLPSMGLLPSPSTWHIVDLLTKCLPERLFHVNHTDIGFLVRSSFLSFVVAKKNLLQSTIYVQMLQI